MRGVSLSVAQVHVLVMVGAASGLAGAGCAGDAADDDLPAGPSVAEVLAQDCATVGVRGLALQIAATMRCLDPAALVAFDEGPRLVFTGSNVVPYLGAAAHDALATAADAAAAPLEINSAFRTVAEQALLAGWADAGRCGITVAAAPGRSNHESGRALDLANWAAVEPAMNVAGWTRNVPGDDVHFEFLAGDDLRGLDVLAFQSLWNANHPDDPIDEDGDYGPATEARLLAAPAGGLADDVCPAAARERRRVAGQRAAVARP